MEDIYGKLTDVIHGKKVFGVVLMMIGIALVFMARLLFAAAGGSKAGVSLQTRYIIASIVMIAAVANFVFGILHIKYKRIELYEKSVVVITFGRKKVIWTDTIVAIDYGSKRDDGFILVFLLTHVFSSGCKIITSYGQIYFSEAVYSSLHSKLRTYQDMHKIPSAKSSM